MKPQTGSDLVPLVVDWLTRNLYGKKRPSPFQQNSLQKHVSSIISDVSKKKFLHVLHSGSEPIAVLILTKMSMARVHNQRQLFFQYDPSHRKKAVAWLKRKILVEGRAAPRFTGAGVFAKDLAELGPALERAGFKIKYDILKGETLVALRELRRRKNPPPDLRHLNLQMRPLRSKKDVDTAIGLQRRVFSKSPKHGNFSHTKSQLERDRKEYMQVLRKKKGLILGVFRERELLGYMAAFTFDSPGEKERSAGFTFCLHPKVQGRGVSKTGYRVLLEFLKKHRISTFRGGTSQDAVKGLGDIMKRKRQSVYYVKADWA